MGFFFSTSRSLYKAIQDKVIILLKKNYQFQRPKETGVVLYSF